MEKARLSVSALLDRLRGSLWFIPGAMVLGSLALGAGLAASSTPAPDIPGLDLLLPVTVEGARSVLQVVAGSVMTVASVVFSLTVVALQITAGNYSPRVLRTFLRNIGTQVVLGTFLATFTFSYIVLQNVSPTPGQPAPSWGPETAFLVVPVFVLGSLAALVFFIHHVTQAIRVEFILKEVLKETLNAIEKVHHPEDRAADGHFDFGREVPPGAATVTAPGSGYIQAYGTKDLVEVLRKEGLVAAFAPSVGDHLLEGTVLAWVWTEESNAPEAVPVQAVHDALKLGPERTMQQDVAFGIRQLVDVAVRALSPGVNDPNTAVATIAHLGVAYGRLAGREIGAWEECDAGNVCRIFVPRPTFGEYLHIACQQIAHYGNKDLMILLRLLQMLGDLKSVATESNQMPIDLAIARVVDEGQVGLELESDRTALRTASDRSFDGMTRPAHHTAAG